MEQLTIDLKPSVTRTYPTCVEYVAARVHQQGVPQKAIAADMDLSPSQLNQKLGPKHQSSARFTLDDLEHYVAVTGDIEPIKYLASKFLYRQPAAELERQIEELQQRLAASA